MSTVKHKVLCHLSVSPSYSPSLSINPSHLICCTICAAVISRTPHVLPFTPLLSLASWFGLLRPTRNGRDSLTDLYEFHNGAAEQTFLSHTTPCCPKARPCQLTQHSFHSSVKARWKHKCQNLRHAPYMYKLHDGSQLLRQNTRPSTPHRLQQNSQPQICSKWSPQPQHTIDLKQSLHRHPTQLDNGKAVWNILCDSLSLWFKHSITEEKLGRCGWIFLKPGRKSSISRQRALCHIPNGDTAFAVCLHW